MARFFIACNAWGKLKVERIGKGMLFLLFFTVALFTALAILYVYSTRRTFTTIDSFLTARGTLGTWASAATVFASIMGAWILFSPAEAGTWGGVIAFVGYAVAQALAIMAYVFLGPRMRLVAPHGSSLAEFAYYRYGKSMYTVIQTVSVFYMAVFLCAELTGIALAVQMIVGAPLWLTALLVGVGTLIYTAYGGIRGSIFTDALQAVVIIPALLLVFVATLWILGDRGVLLSSIREIDPALLSLEHRGAWEFTFSLLIAVVAANLFHQGFWSRVYACRDNATVKKSFLIAGLTIIPVVTLTGIFGLMAVAGGTLQVPSLALFEVVLTAPLWVLMVVLVLAIALVMSSADTLINGMATVFTVDIARFYPSLPPFKLQFLARILTAIICLAVIAIAARGYSVLYLFLLADLVCTAAVFPTFYGLYSPYLSGINAFYATLTGMAAGALLFPNPAFSRGNLLYSFLVALILPSCLSLLLSRVSAKPSLELGSLAEKVHDIKV